MSPHLKVVRHHEVLGDAFPEHAENELFEVAEALEIELLLLRLDQAHQAFEHRFLGQILDVVLEGVGKKAIAHPHPRLAQQLLVFVANDFVEQSIEVFVVREQNMPANIVGEAVGRFLRRRQATHFVSRLEDYEVLVAKLS